MALGKKKSKSFEYKPRDADAIQRRASAGGNREGFLADGVKTFTPKEGQHTVRILPPTWDGAEHYGYDVWAHYNVGPDGGAYLCLQKMNNEHCPICTDRARAIKENDEELEMALKPRQRVACWAIDRDNERDGPMLWLLPWTLDREIVQQSQDKKTREYYNLDSPDEGYDVSFERQGKGQTTKYIGVQLDRRSSPLSDDDETVAEWLEFVQKNPVPDQLVFQDEDKLADLVGDGLSAPKASRDKVKGKDKDDDRPRRKRDDDDDDDKHKPRRSRDDDDDDRKPSRKGKKIDVADLDWGKIHDMGEEELLALAEQEDIDIDDADTEEEAADAICESLKISKRPSLGGRLGGLKKRLGGKG